MNLFPALIGTWIAASAYTLLHEAVHAATAVMLKCKTRASVSTDTLLPSLSIEIDGCTDGAKKTIVLYSPYIINILFITIFGVRSSAGIIAYLTLPNMLLEDDEKRNGSRLYTAALLTALEAIAITRLIPS